MVTILYYRVMTQSVCPKTFGQNGIVFNFWLHLYGFLDAASLKEVCLSVSKTVYLLVCPSGSSSVIPPVRKFWLANTELMQGSAIQMFLMILLN